MQCMHMCSCDGDEERRQSKYASNNKCHERLDISETIDRRTINNNYATLERVSDQRCDHTIKVKSSVLESVRRDF